MKMATAQLAIAAAVMLLIVSSVSAQMAPVMGPSSSSGAMAPTPDCMTNLLNMSDCLSYVTEGSKTAKPDPACCPELAGLVDSSPQCLCYLLDKNATAGYGISIDLSRALKLPSVCRVETPPVSLCSAITGAGVPVKSPTMSPGMSPEAGVAAASPTTGGRDTGGGAIGISISAVLSILALAISFLPIISFSA